MKIKSFTEFCNESEETNYEYDLKEFIYNGYLAFEENYPEAADLFNTHEAFLDALYNILTKRLPQIVRYFNEHSSEGNTFNEWLFDGSHNCPYFTIPVSVFKMNLKD